MAWILPFSLFLAFSIAVHLSFSPENRRFTPCYQPSTLAWVLDYQPRILLSSDCWAILIVHEIPLTHEPLDD
jgi:hypothetical protein